MLDSHKAEEKGLLLFNYILFWVQRMWALQLAIPGKLCLACTSLKAILTTPNFFFLISIFLMNGIDYS